MYAQQMELQQTRIALAIHPSCAAGRADSNRDRDRRDSLLFGSAWPVPRHLGPVYSFVWGQPDGAARARRVVLGSLEYNNRTRVHTRDSREVTRPRLGGTSITALTRNIPRRCRF